VASQRDLVLVPIPFTDLSSARRRPVIVVSSDRYNTTMADMIVVAMTSNLTASPHSFILDQLDLESGRLNRPGRVRVDKVYTISQALVQQTFAKVNVATLDRIRQLLIDLTVP
jgi:mRNA interferase MazF